MTYTCLKLGAIALACAALSSPALAQATAEQLQRALEEARAAAQRAQAAAAAAEAALAKLQAAPAAAAGTTLVTTAVPNSAFSISGTIDLGPRSTSHSDPTRDKTELAFNNAATSLMFFKGSRKLGSGLTGSFSLEIDYNPTQSSTANGPPGSNAYQGTPFTGEQYVALTGGFGDVRLGSPNAGALIAAVTAQPFNTTLASGYSGTFGRLGTSGVSGINQFSGALVGRVIRHEKTLMYTTPVFSGLKASIEHAVGNDNAASPVGNTNQYTGLTAYYNQGPANVVYAFARESAGAIGAAGPTAAIGTPGAVVLPVNTKVSWHILGANYTFGAATLYGGVTSTRHDAAAPLEDSWSWNVAARYFFTPKLALLGNHVQRKSRLATAADGSLLGVGVNYLLDNNTMLYGRAESSSIDAVGTTRAQKQRVYAVGVQYKF